MYPVRKSPQFFQKKYNMMIVDKMMATGDPRLLALLAVKWKKKEGEKVFSKNEISLQLLMFY